jgi:glucose/arabinose dehydrogenase
VDLPTGFQDTEALGGLHEPTNLRFSEDGRIFVAEKSGEIQVFDGLGDPTPTLFADLRPQVYDNGDRGLLALALDPDFPSRPYVYVLYTFDHVIGEDPPGFFPRWGKPATDYEGDPCPKPPDADIDACPVSGRLVRLTAKEGGDQATESGGKPLEHVLIEDWCQQSSTHSIGDLQFGPEGALLASGGEGAGFTSSDYGQFGWPQANQCGDPAGAIGQALEPPSAEGGSLRAQDLRTPSDPTGLDGSLIRIDPETGEGLPGNPLAGSADPNARRIIAYGFRNPFRFSIDPASKEVYVNNVGNGADEEIDRFPIAPGHLYNSGWPCYEGLDPNPGFQFIGLDLCEGLYDEPGSTSPPFFYYRHGVGVVPGDTCPSYNGSAISGSAFYDGKAFPAEYDGAFFFADTVRGCIYVMQSDDGRPDPLLTTPFMVGDLTSYPGVDIEVGPEGDLYYASLSGPSDMGSIHRISYDPGAPVARLSADRLWGELDLTVEFDASGSTDPDEEALEYAWDFDDDGTFETKGGGVRKKTFSTAVNRTVWVKVTDGTKKSSVDKITVFPGDTPPEIEIEEPGESLSWRVGQTIDFSGSATAEEGSGAQLPAANLYWRSRLKHCPFGSGACHLHPLQVFPATESGSLVAPEHDYPSGIQLTLTATDERGLSSSSTVELEPRPVNIQLASDPPGVTLTAGLLTQPAPFGLTAIEGSNVTLVAPQTASVGGTPYVWKGWSDGGARVHTISADASAEYAATYVPTANPVVDPGREGTRSPVVRLRKHPKKRTAKTTARFVFSGDSATSFRCKVDGRPYRPCRSPRIYRRLKPGRHVFRVIAANRGSKSMPVVFPWLIIPPGG